MTSQLTPKKIAIIGLPGSGKSTFSLKLGKLLRIPVYHLDSYQFEGKRKKERSEFLANKQLMLKQSSWIIEGCSISTLEMRFAEADTVFYFNFSRLLCLWRVFKRLFCFKQHQDLAKTGCLVGINWSLIKYIWNFDRDKKKIIQELRCRYPKVDFIQFNNAKDVKNYLRQIE